MANKTFLDLPDEATPQLTDKVFTGRGTSAGAERKPTWQVVRDLFKTYFDSVYAALVHTHTLSALGQSGATNGQAPIWNGAASAWVPGSVSVTADTPETKTIAGAGSSSTARPAGVNDHLVYVNVGGSGTYTHTLTADVANSPVVGTKMRFSFTWAAGTAGATVNLVLSSSLTIPVVNLSGLAGGPSTIDVQYVGGSAWAVTQQSDATASSERTYNIDDVTPGAKRLFIVQKPFSVSSWGLIGDASGSISIGIRKGTTVGGLTSIVASAPPAVSSAQTAQSSTLTGWTKDWLPGEIIEISVTSSSGSATQWSLTLGGVRS